MKDKGPLRSLLEPGVAEDSRFDAETEVMAPLGRSGSIVDECGVCVWRTNATMPGRHASLTRVGHLGNRVYMKPGVLH